MRLRKRTSTLTAATCLIFAFVNSTLLGHPQSKPENPDFTQGESRPEGAEHDWTLGPTGMRGWMHGDRLVTKDARQILITRVEEGSPAEGLMAVGDVILGVEGLPFSYDPRTEFGKAITSAESDAGGGALRLMRWRAGLTETVTIKLPVLGSYSSTAPYECPKSTRIFDQGCRVLAERMSGQAYRPNPITRSLNAMALLASENPDYLPLIKREAEWAAAYAANDFKTWWYGYVTIFLAEYVLATGDDSVMPGLERLALEAVKGQSGVGSWGHTFARPDGRLGGYGMMNSPGLPLTVSLILARNAGVNDPRLDRAIDRSVRLLRFYVGKGCIPYGDHAPWIETHDDNGKNGMAAVMFHLLNDANAAEYFSRMSVASHGAERDCGHTGNFFNVLWAMPGINLSGPNATGAWMDEYGAWYFDLARCWDGTFVHQGPPERKNDSYANWDCTGAYLLAYAVPLKSLYLTGKTDRCVTLLDAETAQALIEDGRGWDNQDRNSYYDGLSDEALFARLSNWSPIVRERAGIALSRRKTDFTERLMGLLDSSTIEAKYGACQALKLQRGRGASAVPNLIGAFRSDDLWLRILAGEALAAIGKPARSAIPEMLERLASPPRNDDPRNMEQRFLSMALFDRRDGLLGRSLEGVDRTLLLNAVRAGLLNEDGRARGSFGSVYENLTVEELRPLLPAIQQAIEEPAPSGIMFADNIRMSGLELFARNHIDEGIELLADYARNQKQHGSEGRIVRVMELLETYGAHAKRVIPDLRVTADYFENEETDFPKKLSREKAATVRATIEKIENSQLEPKLTSISE